MNRYISIPFLLLALLITSCEDYLDKPLLGSQVTENYFGTEAECIAATYGCYESLSPDDWWQLDYFWLVGDVCSDEAFKGNSIEGDQREFGDLANFNINASNEWLEYKWLYTYTTISRCNLVIEKVPDAPVSNELSRLLVSEAKFLRALSYFELVKNFGGVPLVLSVISANDEVVPRSSVEEVYQQIIKDFSAASPYLPLKSGQDAANVGRTTRGAAWAYLAKAHLYAKNWNMAKAFADSVIASGNYSLGDPFEEVWSVSNPNGEGSIFEIQHSYHDVHYIGNALPVITRSRNDGGWGFGTPSSYLEQAMQGDPRLKWTIIKEGDNVDPDHTSYDTKLTENESGRINKKYYLSFNDRPPKDEVWRTGLNHILLRYADLLLMHAEASYHSGQEGDAQNSLNLIRSRVGLGPVNASGENLLNAIYNERQMELALEGHRYYDLKRTGRLTEVITDFVDYNLNRSTDPYDAGNSSGTLFKPGVHELFPIPETEVNLTEGVVDQNTGY